jgi:hypothetical protein
MVSVGKFLLYPFRESNKMKIFMVMIIYPMILLSLQLWITDSLIKNQDKPKEVELNEEEDKLIV